MLIKTDLKKISWLVFFILTSITICAFIFSKPKKQPLQGYIEARLAYIGSPYPGTLSHLAVKRGDSVIKDQPLFMLDDELEKSSYHEAKAAEDRAIAEKHQAEQNLKFAFSLLKRRQELHGKQVLNKEALETAENDYKKAERELTVKKAMVEQANAVFHKAAWTKVQKAVFAKKAGIVFDTYFLPSEFVSPERPVLSLLFPDQTHVIFFVNEPQLKAIKKNQPIQFSYDSGKTLQRARISYISPHAEFTPPILYSVELRRSNLVYRVEAEPVTISPDTLHGGQPVTIYL